MNKNSTLIVENLLLNQSTWSKLCSYSEDVEIDEIFALFNGKYLGCEITTPFEKVKLKLKSGRNKTKITKAYKEFEITIKSENPVLIELLSVNSHDAVNLHEMGIPIDIQDISVIYKPIGWQIAFDFKRAVKILNAEKIPKEVEIRDANRTINIKSSSENFQWRGHILYCRLVVGEYRLRVRLKGSGWSGWLSFKCKRSLWL